jgi:basic membrane protein A and related proteins
MKRSFLIVLLVCAILPLTAAPKVAVLDITAEKGIDTAVVVPVTESIMEEIVTTRAYVVLDRAYIEQILKEKEFQLSGMVSDSQVAQAGQYLGADYVVAGKVQLLGDSYFLVSKMIEVRTGVIVSQSSTQGKGALVALVDMAHSIGKKLVSGAPISPLTPASGLASGGAAGSTAGSGQRIKVAFVYNQWLDPVAIGPTYTVNMAINAVREEYKDWLDVVVASGVHPQDSSGLFDKLTGTDKCAMIFSFDYGFGDQMAAAADRYPNVVFESLGGGSGGHAEANYGITNFAATCQLYMDGLVAGAMSSSGKVGFLSEALSTYPDAVARIDSFALGVKAANQKATVILTVLPEGHWTTPGKEKAATEALIAQGCDFIVGMLTPAVVDVLKSSAMAKKRVLTLCDDRGYAFESSVIVAGPTLDYTSYIKRSLLAVRAGTWKRGERLIWKFLEQELGDSPFNPAFLPELRAKKVKTPDLGEIPLIDLISKRNAQAQSGEFTGLGGPCKDQKGTVRLKAGESASWDFQVKMDWLLDNVKGTLQPR